MKTTLMILAVIFGINTFASSQPAIEMSTKKIEYPEAALINNVEGTVLIYFEIKEGQTTNATVIRSVSPSIDQTAMEMVNEMSEEYMNSLKATGQSEFVMPIKFDIQ